MISMEIPDDLISVPQAARLVGCNPVTIHLGITKGLLTGYKAPARPTKYVSRAQVLALYTIVPEN